MGLKFQHSDVISNKYNEWLKSDQDGIEIKQCYFLYVFYVQLKSDQDGIEIIHLYILTLLLLRS